MNKRISGFSAGSDKLRYESTRNLMGGGGADGDLSQIEESQSGFMH